MTILGTKLYPLRANFGCHPLGYNPSRFACAVEAIAMIYQDDI